MVYIYVLKLEDNKYYVGKTSNPTFRMESHFNENGSAWTKKYKPIKLEALIPDCDDYDEDKYTKKYMDKYGIDNVRGGSFVSIQLNKTIISHLTNMSNSTNNKCFKCGSEGHFAKDCNNSVKEKNQKEKFSCKFCSKLYTNKNKCKSHENACNKNNEKCSCPTSYFSPHRENKCLLRKVMLDESEESESSDEDDNSEDICFICGRTGHYTNDCYAKTDVNGNRLDDDKECCFKCGRQGHYATNCYATKHINGKYLHP